MASSQPFTFGIALIPRASARNWRLVEALLDLTLASVRAQTDPNFRVVLVGHDRPGRLPRDPRFAFLEADWPVEEPGPDNADSGRKRYVINEFVLARGGGHLMFLDADDWVPVDLVERVRACMGPHSAGALIDTGFVVDLQTLRAARVPQPGVFDGGFHRICGSSAVAWLRPDEADPLRRDPWNVLGSHHQWLEAARERDAELVRLPVPGSYVTNTTENHSEIHGPYAAWRGTLTTAVNRAGAPLDRALAARFGLDLDRIRAVSEAFFRPSDMADRSVPIRERWARR